MLFFEGGERITDAIRTYLLSVITAAFFCSMVLAIIPKGGVRRAASFASALVMALVTLAPVVKLNYEDLARSIAAFRIEAQEAQTGVEVKNAELVESIIRHDCETYILDKAEGLGASVTANVLTRNTGSGAYPYEVTLRGEIPPEKRQVLSQIITNDLAIPPERQVWK